jgi:hypothetical protein
MGGPGGRYDGLARRASQPPALLEPLAFDTTEMGHSGRSLRFWFVICALALVLIAAAGLLLYRIL